MDLARKMSVDILYAYDKNNDRLPIIIDKYIEKYEVPFSQKQRSKIAVNEIIRYRGLIDYIIEESSSRKMRYIQPKLKSILRLGCYDLLFDEIIPELPGGAHRNFEEQSNILEKSIITNLNDLEKLNILELVSTRKNKYLNITSQI